jgi:hypothetical protein
VFVLFVLCVLFVLFVLFVVFTMGTGTKATMNNQPELAQLLEQKVTEMKTALHGVASLAADDLKTKAMRANEEALNVRATADQSTDGGGKDLIALQEVARAKVTEVMVRAPVDGTLGTTC